MLPHLYIFPLCEKIAYVKIVARELARIFEIASKSPHLVRGRERERERERDNEREADEINIRTKMKARERVEQKKSRLNSEREKIDRCREKI